MCRTGILNRFICMHYYSGISKLLSKYSKQDVIVCIGTPELVFDSVGPLIGDILQDYPLDTRVIGTSSNPVDSTNVKSMSDVLENKSVLAIDSAHGGLTSILGSIVVKTGSIKPGSGLGKNLGEIGNISIEVITTKDTLKSLLYADSKYYSRVSKDKIKFITKFLSKEIVKSYVRGKL